MDAEQHKAALNRVRSAIGHMQAIERMLVEGVYCIDIIAQVQAVQSALGRVNEVLLENHLEHCVTDALRGDDAEARARVIDELQAVFTVSRKVRLATRAPATSASGKRTRTRKKG